MKFTMAIVMLLGLNQAWATQVNFSQTERALVVLTNQERLLGGLRPVIWNDNLYLAALKNSQNLVAANGTCNDWHACPDNLLDRAIAARYYLKKPKTYHLGENAGSTMEDAFFITQSFMGSTEHRPQIMAPELTELGVAFVSGSQLFVTESFGTRGDFPIGGIPKIPAGGYSAGKLVANYFDEVSDQAPLKFRVQVGNSCKAMNLVSGSAGKGTYMKDLNLQPGECTGVRFQALGADGEILKFPWDGSAMGIAGVDAQDRCAKVIDLPVIDCLNAPIDNSPPPVQPPVEPPPVQAPPVVDPPVTPPPPTQSMALSVSAAVEPAGKSGVKVQFTLKAPAKTKGIFIEIRDPNNEVYKTWTTGVGVSGQLLIKRFFANKIIKPGPYKIKVSRGLDKSETSFNLR